MKLNRNIKTKWQVSYIKLTDKNPKPELLCTF